MFIKHPSPKRDKYGMEYISHQSWAMWLAWHVFDHKHEKFDETLKNSHKAVPLMRDIKGNSSYQRIIDRCAFHIATDLKGLTGSVKIHLMQIVSEAQYEKRLDSLPKDKDKFNGNIKILSITKDIDDNGQYKFEQKGLGLLHYEFEELDYTRVQPADIHAGEVNISHYRDIEYTKFLKMTRSEKDQEDRTPQLPNSLRQTELDNRYMAFHGHETSYHSLTSFTEWNTWLHGTRVDLFDKMSSGEKLTKEEIEAYCDNDYDIEGFVSCPLMDIDRPMQPEIDAYVLADDYKTSY